MYLILHIPTGQYLYNEHGVPIKYLTINKAEDDISYILETNTMEWNDYNKEIGYNVGKIEFEIIEVKDV